MEINTKFLIKYFINEFEIIKKNLNFSFYFLILHILFTLNTILFALTDPKLDNYLNITSIIFSLITCVTILIYESSNCHKKLKFIMKCVIFSCFCISSKLLFARNDNNRY